MENKSKHTKNSGFTLIELVIAVLILGILISYGIGPLRDMLLRNQVANQANLIQLDLSFARSEAINRSYHTMVIPKESWESGWDIVIDKNKNGTFEEDEEIVRSTAYDHKKIKLTDSEESSPIIFTAFGNLKSAKERNFVIKHKELPNSKMIVIAAAGSITVRSIENEN